MKLIAGLLLVVGIILLAVGVFQWQDGLNMQNITSAEETQISRPPYASTSEEEKRARIMYPTYYSIIDRIQAGEDKEVLGITLLVVGGILTLGSGIGLYSKQ